MIKQTTVADRVELQGIGVHSGQPARLIIHPSDVDTGHCFQRTGLAQGGERFIQASYRNVGATELCTVIGDGSGATVSTIEHLLAALAGLGIDNALIEIDGAEIPIMDGSSRQFIEAIDQVGIKTQSAPRSFIKILKPVRVELGRSWAELLPHAAGFRLDVEIAFDTPLIGVQRRICDLSPESFRNDIAGARTFGFMRDVEKLWKMGFALGASLENTVALGEDKIVNPEGLRWKDEFARHKILDAIGDLSLAGMPIRGLYRAHCPGHKVNFTMLAALFADKTAYEIVESTPARRESGHAELSVSAQPAYAAQK